MQNAEYRRPWFLFNRHIETIYPTLFRKVGLPKEYQRERIATPDHDFLDLDWLRQGSKNCVIISHGLEGNTHRSYVKGMANAFFKNGDDVLAWNFRGCSGELNKTVRFYHSGATEDLHTVIEVALQREYQNLFLIGFSLGGNLTIKYAGERKIDSRIKSIVTFSVPLELHSSSLQLAKFSNEIYTRRFLKSLTSKVIAKAKVFPLLNIAGIDQIKNLNEFDEQFTAPLHGFKNAMDYYAQSSSLQFVEHMTIPTLIVNAANDPFLSKECFPQKILNPLVSFQSPKHGGHVGFSSFDKTGLFWSERIALDFINSMG